MKYTSFYKKLLVTTLAILMVFSGTPKAEAAPADYQQAKVSFTFDDGFQSTYTDALPVLSSRNIKATVYVTAGYVDNGVTGDANLPAMNWTQVQNLQNTYGWEIAGHTMTHAELPLLTQAGISAELNDSTAELQSHGLNISNFATPFGAYDNVVLEEALKLYESHRGFADIGYNTVPYTAPYGKGVLVVQDVNSATTVAQVKAYIDSAITNKQWLILVYHHVAPTLNPNYEYTNTTADLAAVADYVNTKGIPALTVRDALQKPGVNVIQNYDLANGFTNWRTDNATQVTVDTANNGAYSTTTNQNSVKITGGTSGAHLFSDMVQAVPGADYLLEVFYNTTGLTTGELGFYIDEYDVVGNWISGKWIGMVANNAIGYFNAFYTATSNLVSQLSVQTYLTAGATGTAYVDNVDLHNLSASGSATPTPTVSITPTATPSGTPAVTPTPNANFVANGGFETVSGGFATSWTKNTNNWAINTAGTGNAGTNSAQLNANGVQNHLFTTLFTVPNNDTYTWSSFINTSNLVGEFGFYVDEYDAVGTWISGQWKGMINTAFNGIKTYVYAPTSNLVNQIRLQYYNTAGTTGNVTLDSVSLTSNIAPTPTPSTGSGSPTPTPSVSVTPTPTVSVTPTVTPTGTVTPTPTVSVTPTPTVSVTPTVTPSVTPSVTPTPGGTNLVLNPSFEAVSGGFATSWTHDTANWLIDTSSAGNDGANSAKLTINSARNHLFTTLLDIDATKSYTWKTYVKTTNLTGEFGFYIDEYDAAGNWISGQWKTMISGPTTNTISIAYTPTTAAVKKVRLQYYTTATSTGDVLVDSVSFVQN